MNRNTMTPFTSMIKKMVLTDDIGYRSGQQARWPIITVPTDLTMPHLKKWRSKRGSLSLATKGILTTWRLSDDRWNKSRTLCPRLDECQPTCPRWIRSLLTHLHKQAMPEGRRISNQRENHERVEGRGKELTIANNHSATSYYKQTKEVNNYVKCELYWAIKGFFPSSSLFFRPK